MEKPLLNAPNKVRAFAHRYSKEAFAIITAAIIIVALLSIVSLTQNFGEIIAKRQAMLASIGLAQKQNATTRTFATTTIIASSAVVFDATTGTTLFEKDADTSKPLASVAKLITAVTAEMITHSTSSSAIKDIITISPEDIKADGDSGLKAGEQWRLAELLRLTLVTSSNDGAFAIARHFGGTGGVRSFLASANAYMNALGFTSIHTSNPAGLDNENETAPGAVGSARDITKLTAFILNTNPDLLTGTNDPFITTHDAVGTVHLVKNTNVLTGDLPFLVGGKTGYTDLAGGNLMVVINIGINHPVVLVVLGSTYDDRFADIKALASSTAAYFNEQ